MKKQTRLLSLPAIVMAAMVSMLISSVSVRAMGTDLIWTVVTSEDDFGPGTLRQAILDVNAGGSTAPNAIAFAKNVKTIQLQSLLPTITEPALIDGLAKVSNGTVVQEGDCSMLPSPVNDPCAFSCALRVTIDGSTIPLAVSPDARAGLTVESDNVTIRGICITNITTSDPNSRAIGISINFVENTVECCEVKNIRNTAGSSTNTDENFAAGIIGSTYDVTKTYVHTIQGGLINIDCEIIADNTTLASGSAYGISGQVHVIDSRVEQIESGSIIACALNSTGSEMGTDIRIGTSNGIIGPQAGPEQQSKSHCSISIECTDNCNEFPLIGSEITTSVENSVVTNITGGSLISNVNNVSIVLDIVAGIRFEVGGTGSSNFLVSNNSVTAIHSGNAVISGNDSEVIYRGCIGIIILNDNGIDSIRCNTVTDVTLGIIQASGLNTKIDAGTIIGIFHRGADESFIECNTVSKIDGGRIVLEGSCGLLILPDELNKSRKASISKHNSHSTPSKNVPSGTICIPDLGASVIGILTINKNSLVSYNRVNFISGGTRITQGIGAQAFTLGTIGIAAGDNDDSNFALVDNNSVYSVVGAALTAQAGGSIIQNLKGSAGITVKTVFAEVTNNCVEQIAEGKVRVNNNSTVAHFTDLRTLQKTRNYLINSADADTWFVPVVTAGISVSGLSGDPRFRQIEPSSEPPVMRVNNNTVTNVIGASVPGGTLPQGSIGVGLFIQPSFRQLTDPFSMNFKSKASPVSELCMGTTFISEVGDINTNTIRSIFGGTHSPAYGILLDGSQVFFDNFSPILSTGVPFALSSLSNNTISSIKGNGRIEPFTLSQEQLNQLQDCCISLNGSGTECDLPNNFIPLLPFEPTSGIYTLFGGCSALDSNTINKVTDTKADARGITTAASSNMDIFDNIISFVKGFGIFVGGSVVDETLATGTEFLLKEVLPSVRNKIYNNSTFDNTNKGIELGLIDWNYFVFARTILDACKTRLPKRLHQEAPEDSFVTYGNHGQVAPCIKKVTCNSNGTITIDVTLTSTLPLTDFIIQFFRNSSNGIPHGEQHISMFDDPQFILPTSINGNAKARFTFLPLAKIQKGDNISAHVTVKDDVLSPAGDEFFGDTSEFSTDTQTSCPLSGLTQKPSTPSRPDFCNVLYRTPEEEIAA